MLLTPDKSLCDTNQAFPLNWKATRFCIELYVAEC